MIFLFNPWNLYTCAQYICSNLFSVSGKKKLWPNVTWRESGLCKLILRVHIRCGWKPRQELKQEPERETMIVSANWFSPWLRLSGFLIHPKPSYLWMVPATVGWALPHSFLIKVIPHWHGHRTVWWRQSTEVPSSHMTLGNIKLTIKQTKTIS